MPLMGDVIQCHFGFLILINQHLDFKRPAGAWPHSHGSILAISPATPVSSPTLTQTEEHSKPNMKAKIHEQQLQQ